jgi:hypothetical protein
VLWAGPPFFTDDPETVEPEHWEVYLASQGKSVRHHINTTAPHIEVNYGACKNVQLHLVTTFSYDHPGGNASSHYGVGDTELGVKWRFWEETPLIPQIGIFPLVEAPTGSRERGLGNGQTQVFLPLWMQKAFGKWSTYGGGGYWINPGSGNRNYWFAGWQGQREISEELTLGAEVYHAGASQRPGRSSTGFNVGGSVNFTKVHHLLFSGGCTFQGPRTATWYIGYQATF